MPVVNGLRARRWKYCLAGVPAVVWSEYRRRNDIVVSQRCKHCGMSWTESGVLAVATYAENIKQKIFRRTNNSHQFMNTWEKLQLTNL